MDGCRCSRDSTGRSPLVVESSILVAPDPLRGGWVSFLALGSVDMLPLALSAARHGRGADSHAFISSNEPPSYEASRTGQLPSRRARCLLVVSEVWMGASAAG